MMISHSYVNVYHRAIMIDLPTVAAMEFQNFPHLNCLHIAGAKHLLKIPEVTKIV